MPAVAGIQPGDRRERPHLLDGLQRSAVLLGDNVGSARRWDDRQSRDPEAGRRYVLSSADSWPARMRAGPSAPASAPPMPQGSESPHDTPKDSDRRCRCRHGYGVGAHGPRSSWPVRWRAPSPRRWSRTRSRSRPRPGRTWTFAVLHAITADADTLSGTVVARRAGERGDVARRCAPPCPCGSHPRLVADYQGRTGRRTIGWPSADDPIQHNRGESDILPCLTGEIGRSDTRCLRSIMAISGVRQLG